MSLSRVAIVCTLMFALVVSPLAGTAKAADDHPLPGSTHAPSVPLVLGPSTTAILNGQTPVDPTWQSWSDTASSSAVQRGRYRGGRYGGGGRSSRSAAAAALFIGAAAAIAGTAILTYANRPECDRFGESGCGYGTKVVGTSVLVGGVVGVAVGAALWR